MKDNLLINNKKIIIVLPAYNAQATLKGTFEKIPKGFADEVILVDDFSSDDTVKISKNLGITTICHSKNLGYGANQKTCYIEALKSGADVVIMLHPDGQYEPGLSFELANKVANEEFDCVLASRFLNNSAKYSKMPRYKYFANRFLTEFQNLIFNKKLSEYHTGYRAFSKNALESIDFNSYSDNFVFDNQMLADIIAHNFKISEIPCPCIYENVSSSINLKNSIIYGLGVLWVSFKYMLNK